LNNVLKNNSIHFIQKIDSIGNQQQKKLSDLDKKMTDLESNLERLKSENIEMYCAHDSIAFKISHKPFCLRIQFPRRLLDISPVR
jgi:hypothetical protein